MHGFSHLFRLDQAAASALGIELILGPVGDQGRHDGAGRDRPDAQAVRNDLPAQRMDESLNFGRSISPEIRR